MLDAEFCVVPRNQPFQRGDYFDTHDVVGKAVTRILQVDLTKWGYHRESGSSSIQIKEVTRPVYDETGLYVVRALRYDVPQTEGEKKKTHYSLVYLGGGSSDAKTHSDTIARIEDALLPLRDRLPFAVDKIVVVPHIAGSPRTKGDKDAGRQYTLAAAARVLQTALADPELNIATEGLILAGYSAGGTQAIELASLYGKRCQYLLLIDPGGMAEHPKLAYEFTIGSLFSAMEKYQGSGMKFLDALKATLWEFRVAWGSSKGVPSFADMVRDMLTPSPTSRQLARAYGFTDEQAATTANMISFATDSTKEARAKVSARVIFSPVLFAEVVNIIISRLKDKYPTMAALKAVNSQQLNANVTAMLHEMFPKSADVCFAGYPGKTHSEVRVEQAFWNNMFQSLLQATNTT